jgi:predicted GIY-YIG superfamily endonuclease
MNCVYQIQNRANQIIYIGSTNNLYQRTATHKQRFHNGYTSYLYQYMRINGSFADYKFAVVEETNNLLERERYWIQHYNPICNYQTPLRTIEEKREQQKKSYQKNIEKYKAHSLEPIQCHCGKTYTRQNRIRHENSKYHLEYGTTNIHNPL